MKIAYVTRFRDLWRFNAVHQLRSLSFQSLMVLVSLLFAWATVNGSHCGARGYCGTVGVGAFVLVYAVGVGAQCLYNAAFLFSRKNRNVLTEHRVELRAEGLYEETAYVRSLFLWPGLNKIVTAAGFVAVYVTAHSALLIPNESFESATQREEFIQLIRANMKAASR